MMPGNPVVGSTILRRPAIQSPNFVTGVSGWTVNADGSAEFNNLNIRGTFTGTDFVINSAGAFFYSGTPAANNLIASITAATGTDAFGNHYLEQITSYDNANGIATQVGFGAVTMYTGTLAGGWTQKGQMFVSPGGVIELIATAGVITSNNTLDNGAGGASFNGALTAASLSSGGASSTSTNGLPNGTITGTSGGASAGTAHTHGGGSYSVSNGQHHHTI